MKIYSFPRGGIPYDDPTAPQKDSVANAFLPAISIVPLGISSDGVYPVVTPGALVKEGMLIGRASKTGTVNAHASVPGKVLRKISWKDNDGLTTDALVIKMEGAFEKLGRKEELFQWNGMSGPDIQRTISELGIVEMEKNGRPLSEMISAARRKSKKLTLVIRCVFDDPWLAADYALCRDRFDAVIEGAAIVAKAVFNVSQIIIAVSHRENELGETLLNEMKKYEYQSALVLTGSRYPQRNNRELELALRIYEKKEEMDLGALLILGPAVLAAACDAVKHKRPILDRYVAVGGSAVKRPQIMRVRIGTRIGELIEQCGGFSDKPYRIVTGSPLSGREVMYLDEPVGKTCYAIAAMTKAQAAIHKQQNCINCGECRAVCPVGLDPQNIYKRIKNLGLDNLGTTGCYGCGCCKIVCPAALPLSEIILEKKQEGKIA
ncbi:MAG: SLBB domain-containing protein [Treponema sp.]|jgi:electron transport complex protein RnfC|nr:SLBB domain-containing protein [Treponema sp.]